MFVIRWGLAIDWIVCFVLVLIEFNCWFVLRLNVINVSWVSCWLIGVLFGLFVLVGFDFGCRCYLLFIWICFITVLVGGWVAWYVVVCLLRLIGCFDLFVFDCLWFLCGWFIVGLVWLQCMIVLVLFCCFIILFDWYFICCDCFVLWFGLVFCVLGGCDWIVYVWLFWLIVNYYLVLICYCVLFAKLFKLVCVFVSYFWFWLLIVCFYCCLIC